MNNKLIKKILYFVSMYTYKYCDLDYIAPSKPNSIFFYVKKGYCITLLYQLLNFSTFVQILRNDI